MNVVSATHINPLLNEYNNDMIHNTISSSVNIDGEYLDDFNIPLNETGGNNIDNCEESYYSIRIIDGSMYIINNKKGISLKDKMRMKMKLFKYRLMMCFG